VAVKAKIEQSNSPLGWSEFNLRIADSRHYFLMLRNEGMQFLIVLWVMLCAPYAVAQQSQFRVEKGAKEWSFDIRWVDGQSKRHRAQFALPAARIQNDLNVPLQFQKRAANVEIVRAVNDYGESINGVQMKARVSPGGKVQVSARGKPGPTRKALKGVKSVQEKALKKYMKHNGFTKLRGRVIPNHARYARQYADHLGPLAVALGAGEIKRRQFASRALSFVQAIPYERGKNGTDKGFRLPLALLGKNRGDCDSKAALYLGVLRAAHPKLDTAMIYIKGHAFVGLGLQPKSGDMTFEAGGREWVIAEPVGPAMTGIGKAAKNSKKKARQGKIAVRRVKPE
jgi:hypothetical protein